ncbi:hypothetical protein [Lentzea terrae]|jgi:hypothetical protein|uniref:hypothetical protein n=1 Tax=Lentzea terrae TaxID=2200761 RepID=UPI000DD2D1E4|nr:hypothetical protein [Lentzea terrae]
MHRVSRTAVRATVGALVTAGLAIGFTTPASAAASSSAIVNTDKTRAAEAFFNRSTSGSHAGKAWIDLYDAKCDAHSVYVEYRINDGGTKRFTNGGGCGNTSGVNLQTGYFAIVYRACVDVQFGGDPCSKWVSDHN